MASQGPNSPTSVTSVAGGSLVWTNPSNATAADGVYATISYSGGAPTDNNDKLVVAGALAGLNRATSASWTTTLSYYSFGSPTDLWGLTSPTVSQVNASNFGVALGGSMGGTSSNLLWATGFGFTIPTGSTINGFLVEELRSYSGISPNLVANVDHIRMTVYYTPSATTLDVSESGFADDAHSGGLAVTMPATEAPAAVETPTGAAAWSLSEVEVTTALAALAAGLLTDDAASASASLDPLAPYLLTVEAWTADDPAAFDAAWTLVDSTAETDAADHYDLLTPLEESAGWDDPLAYVPLLLLTEAGAATEAPDWSAWSLAAADGVSLNADAATLAATLAAADAPPGLDLSGFVTPVLLVGDLATSDSSALLTPLLVSADGWGMTDPATLAATFLPTDTYASLETLASAATLNPAETAIGGDSTQSRAQWVESDSPHYSEALTGAAVGLMSEAVTGREASPTMAALLLPSEVITGADGQALAATLRPADAIGGESEALTGAVTLQPTERPAWSEGLIVAAAWSWIDAVAPVESARSSAAWPMKEGWIGSEAGTFSVAWPLLEWWVPREAPSLVVGLVVSEGGTWAEPVALSARLNPLDVGPAADGLVVAAVLAPRESPPWTDRPELAAAGVLTDAASEGSGVFLLHILPAAESFAPTSVLGIASQWNLAEPTGVADAPLFAGSLVSSEVSSGLDALRCAGGWPLAEMPFASDAGLGFASKWGWAEVLTAPDAFARSESYPVREAVAWADPLVSAAAWNPTEASIARDAIPLLTAVWPLGEVAAGGDVISGPAAWSIRESGPVQEVPGLSQTWTVTDAASQGGVGPSLSHLLTTSDTISGAELARSGAVLMTSEAIGATTVSTSDARWYTGDAWSALDRPVVASVVLLLDAGGTVEAVQATSLIPVSEAISASDDLTASARWLPIETIVAADVPDPTGLPPTRQDTDLHSRVTITPGAPAAPRSIVTPNAPTGRIAPAAGQPDPSRTTVT